MASSERRPLRPAVLLAVAAGGAVGACLRWTVRVLRNTPRKRFPVGHRLRQRVRLRALRRGGGGREEGAMTLVYVAVNVLGSLLLGLFTGLALSASAQALLAVGFCGALTTYSTRRSTS